MLPAPPYGAGQEVLYTRNDEHAALPVPDPPDGALLAGGRVGDSVRVLEGALLAGDRVGGSVRVLEGALLAGGWVSRRVGGSVLPLDGADEPEAWVGDPTPEVQSASKNDTPLPPPLS